MKKEIHQKIIGNIRSKTPLAIRQSIGPILARFYYAHRLYLRGGHKKPKILSIEETVDTVLEKKLSMIRFGDGEITLIDGLDLPFQKWSKDLAEKLEAILQVENEKLLICIPGMWGRLDIFMGYAYHFIMHHMYRYNHVWNTILSYSRTYGDTNVTRHYLAYKDKTKAKTLFEKIKSLWQKEHVILIEGAKSRLGVGNDLFKNTVSVKRILCPPENAFSKVNDIETEVLKYDTSHLILLSLGPTAKVLAYSLFL